ncbi:MAG: aromatic ring-hydroxylating dioxygenase subunit alpha [Actinomycetota bacterium]|nr:aromatic ring-hydroxylating dioxygenase subunit alpha [Actinomycetota bacterium]
MTAIENGAALSLPALEHPLEDGWTLPAGWYSEPAVLELERNRVFAQNWQYAGWTDQVVQPASYFTSVAGHIPVVVLRDREGELRGFVNVCRHRGHLVAQGAGCRETLQCPYHAWTYDLDGSLRKAPRSEREPGFDMAAYSLLPVAVATWGPFVFVNPDVEAAPLHDALGPLPELVAKSGIDLDAVRFHSHHEWEQPVNWKVALENYLECYHCPTAHPGFSKVIDVDPDSYRLQVDGGSSSQLGPVRASALNGKGSVPYDPRGEVKQSQYHFFWPNTTVNIAPGPQNISIERWVPIGPKTTVEVTDYFFGADLSEERITELMAWDNQVAEEDVSLVQSVQQGLDSGMVTQGRMMPESEQLVADFQRRLYDALTGVR